MVEEERYVYIFWGLTLVLASLIGDSIILIGTIKYKAIRQHKVIIAVIQHMAVCDLLQAVFRVFPSTLASITDRWVLGDLLGHVRGNISYISAGVTLLLTTCMTTLKLVILKRPLQAGPWTSKLGHEICAAMWFLLLCLYSPVLVVNLSSLRKSLYFNYKEYDCSYDYSSSSIPTWYLKYLGILILTLSILCYITMIETSILILIAARGAASRLGQSLRWEGITTVLLTVVVLLVSYLPQAVLTVTSFVGVEYSDTLWLAVNNLTFLNLMANFFVYCLTVRSFRLKLKVSELLNLLRRCTQQRVPPPKRPYPTYATGSTLNNVAIQDASI